MPYASYNDYFEPLDQYVTAVFEDSLVSHRDLDIADHRVRMVSSHAPLIDILIPAIEHLSCNTSAATPDFTIFLVDISKTKGGQLPVIPWEPLLRRGHRGIYIDGMYMQYVHIEPSDVMILSVYDTRKNQAYYIVSDAEKLPWYLSGAPLHEIFYWWARSNNMHILHCGVIGNQQKGIALLGAKGAGKSTMVLTFLENGFHYISEDYCIVTGNKEPVAYSLYNSAKFTGYTFEKFPHLSIYKRNNDTINDKHLVYYKDIYPDKLLKKLPLQALVTLNLQINAPSTLKKLDMDKAYLDMIASTTLQNPVYELSSTDFFQKMKLKVTAYELQFGSDTKKTQELLSALIQ